MIQVSWAAVAGFLTLVVMVGPAFYRLGQISKQVDVNTGNIKTIYGKLEDIHNYVKNGRGG